MDHGLEKLPTTPPPTQTESTVYIVMQSDRNSSKTFHKPTT